MSCSSIPGLQPSQSGGFAASPEPWQELQVARAASRDAEERCQGVVTQLLAAGVQGGAEELLLLLLEPARTSKGVTSSSCDVLGRDGTPGVTSHLAASSPPFPVPSGPCASAILGFLRGSDLITSPLHSEPGIKVWLPCIWGGDSPCEQLQTAANSCKQLQTAADSCRQLQTANSPAQAANPERSHGEKEMAAIPGARPVCFLCSLHLPPICQP